jgi:hypothetical protein
MMAKKPQDRYQTPAEVAAALAPFVGQVANLPPKKAGWQPAPRRHLLAASLLAALLLAGGVVYRIQTDKGELVITTESDDVEVVVRKNGEFIRIIDTKTEQSITLRSGVYELELKDAPKGLKLDLEKATLKRGEKTLARIERQPMLIDAKIRPHAEQVGEKLSDPQLISQVSLPGVFFHPHLDRFSADTRWLVLPSTYWSTSEKTIRVLETKTGRLAHVIQGIDSAAQSALVTPDGRRLLACHSDGSFRIWDLETGKFVRADQLRHPGGAIYLWAFSPDGKHFAATALDRTGVKSYYVWEFETGKEAMQYRPTAPGDMQNYCRFSPDGKYIVTVESEKPEGTIGLHEIANGASRSIPIDGFIGGSIAFRDSGRQIGILRFRKATGWAVEFIDAGTGKSVERIDLGIKEVEDIRLSPDGRYCISSHGSQGRVRFFDLQVKTELHDQAKVPDAFGVVVSPDSRIVAVGGRDTVSLFRLPDPSTTKDKP